jgi:hypothetical protein
MKGHGNFHFICKQRLWEVQIRQRQLNNMNQEVWHNGNTSTFKCGGPQSITRMAF